MSNNKENNNYDMIFKIVLIGDSSVGKTNILSKYISDEYDPDTQATIGVELSTKNYTFDNNEVKVQIWDTAGQEKYRSITSSYYKGAHGCLLVYDITRKATFENIDKWLAEIKLSSNNEINMVLIGNKCDLEDKREVSIEEAQNKAKLLNMAFMETSALNGTNVEKAFNELVNNVYQNNKQIFHQDVNISCHFLYGNSVVEMDLSGTLPHSPDIRNAFLQILISYFSKLLRHTMLIYSQNQQV